MSNIKKIAPYAYLARQSSNIYDLYLLVPVDSRKTVDLANVEPETGAGTHIYISYTSVAPAPNEPTFQYKARHWQISKDSYQDIVIQADNNEDLVTTLRFIDADPVPATSTDDRHTFAPYVFIDKEIENGHFYFRPSLVVLFESGTGAQGQLFTLSDVSSEFTVTPGESAPLVTDPEKFAVNQGVRHEINGVIYTFVGTVDESLNLNKPIRKGKTTKMWSTVARSNGVTASDNLEKAAGAKL